METSPRLRFTRALNILGPYLGLLFVIGVFAVNQEIRPFFLSGANFKIVLTHTVVVAICALGMTLVIVSGGIDLSLGSSVALTSVVGATLIAKGWGAGWVVLLTVLAGAALGALNGAVIAGFRMMPFIVTLGTMGVARGVAKWLAGNQTVNYPESPINRLMAYDNPEHLLPLPPGVWIALVLAVLVALVLNRTVFGRYVFAIGANETATAYSGVAIARHRALTYALAGLLFGVGGLMQLSRLTQGDPSIAIGLELDVIAAVVIGGASLSGGTGSIAGSLIGALTMAVLRNGSNQSGWPNYMQEIVIGVIIVAAVGLDKWRQRRGRT